jgi:hypothetical protein
MSFAQTIFPWLGSNKFHLIVVLCCLVLAMKLYFNAFSRRIFVTLMGRRLKTVLKPSGNGSSVATPASTAAAEYAGSEKAV